MTALNAYPEFDITDLAHDGCEECMITANTAAITARATGSVGATHSIRGAAGSIIHSATVKRVRCDRTDNCLCPVHLANRKGTS